MSCHSICYEGSERTQNGLLGQKLIFDTLSLLKCPPEGPFSLEAEDVFHDRSKDNK